MLSLVLSTETAASPTNSFPNVLPQPSHSSCKAPTKALKKTEYLKASTAIVKTTAFVDPLISFLFCELTAVLWPKLRVQQLAGSLRACPIAILAASGNRLSGGLRYSMEKNDACS